MAQESTAGVNVFGASFFKRPGRKKEAGETLPPALIPPQPVNTRTLATRIRTEIAEFLFTLIQVEYG